MNSRNCCETGIPVNTKSNVTCYDCNKVYSRPEHLQRHLLSHMPVASHRCFRCHRSFKRKDVLTRHLTTCSIPTRSVSPANATFAKKRKFSETQRKHGNTDKPALTARRHALLDDNWKIAECYRPPADGLSADHELRDEHSLDEFRLSVSNDLDTIDSTAYFSLPVAPVTAGLHVTMPTEISCRASALSPSKPFDFLIRVTKSYDLRISFGSPLHCYIEKTKENSGPLSPPSTPATVVLPDASPFSNADSWSHPEIALPKKAPQSAQRQQLSESLTDGVTEYTPSQLKVHEIHGALRCAAPEWTFEMQSRCNDFFAAPRIAYAITLYWLIWYPHCPITHKPSFNVSTTPASLLAAMILIGARHSPAQQDLADAEYWFDIVEQLAFADLKNDVASKSDYTKIQNVQAAYLVCIYQCWDGGSKAQTRIRRERHNNIVCAVRDLDMSSFSHGVLRDAAQFDWLSFIRIEESIRTLLWVYLLDTAFVIYNNLPPRFALRELRMGLASCEASFQASTREQCHIFLQAWLLHNPRPVDLTLYGLIKLFFSDDMKDGTINTLAHEGFLNLWCVDSAFHVVLFSLDPTLGGEDQFRRLRIGLENWETVWNRRLWNNDEKYFDLPVTTKLAPDTTQNIHDIWKRPGFWKHAAEYWSLACILLDRMLAARESAHAADDLCGMNASHLNVGAHVHDRVEDASMISLHSFLLSLEIKPQRRLERPNTMLQVCM